MWKEVFVLYFKVLQRNSSGGQRNGIGTKICKLELHNKKQTCHHYRYTSTYIYVYIYIPSFFSLDYQVIRASLSPTYTQLHNATDSLLHTAFLHVRMLSSSSCSKQNHYSLFPHIVGTQTGSSPAEQIGVCLGYCKPTPSSSIQSILFVGHDGNIKTFYAKETGMPLLYLGEYESIHLGAEIDSVKVPKVLELMSYTSVR